VRVRLHYEHDPAYRLPCEVRQSRTGQQEHREEDQGRWVMWVYCTATPPTLNFELKLNCTFALLNGP